MEPARAFASLQKVIRPVTLIEPSRISAKLGIELCIASETFQRTGSFKFRAAYNLVSQVSQNQIITASSGNFGQALAHACQLLNKTCIVVMPQNSAQVKIDAVREFGGNVDLIDFASQTRKGRVLELARKFPGAYVASAYDDPHVIEGNATLGMELGMMERRFDCIIAPIGGGGLAAGLIEGLRAAGVQMPVWGAEPLLANDAARSLQAGRIITHETEPETIADGVRTLSLGGLNWPILRDGLRSIIEVPDEKIRESLRRLFLEANLKVEPTGALAFAALLTCPELFESQRVCCIASGGNVDPALFSALLEITTSSPCDIPGAETHSE